MISSASDYRVPAPPRPNETQDELRALDRLISQNDSSTQQQIVFWDAGAPAYRWIDLISACLPAGTATTAYSHRVYNYVALAMYDAATAAIALMGPVHASTVTAVGGTTGFVATDPLAQNEVIGSVFGYFGAQLFANGPLKIEYAYLGKEAGDSRIWAGIHFQMDNAAGAQHGRAVAQRFIQWAQRDGSQSTAISRTATDQGLGQPIMSSSAMGSGAVRLNIP